MNGVGQPLTCEDQLANCRGVVPLTPRLEPWMQSLVNDERLFEWVASWGSPLNLITTAPLRRHLDTLNQTAAERQLSFQVFFARKANKCLAFVDAANQLGVGIDVASENELKQVIAAGFDGSRIVCTAAIKTSDLLSLCIQHGVTVVIDNSDEFKILEALAVQLGKGVSVAVRLSGFRHRDQPLYSRFGVDVSQAISFAQHHWPDPGTHPVRLAGIQFHLDGYCGLQRIDAIEQSLAVIDSLCQRGHDICFLDIGGGFPMSYLNSAEQWEDFWRQHQSALLNERPEITHRNHSLGRVVINGSVEGQPNCYPYYQSPVQAEWLSEILDQATEGGTIADRIRSANLELRCEPGRSVLDGCGVTVARVEYRKQHRNGHWLIGLSMNRTQCRTTSDDFLVDPILIHTTVERERMSVEMDGYLVGAYCTESELISWRRFQFPSGVDVGDLIMFPNTAGYLMHFLESRSHQFPLANNILFEDGEAKPDRINDC